ncbi:hypothetical protein EG346_09915 [Chryseobacterium carnipullorum]|uniref:Uncharacterized protein n=1 Tax=Chryseobacterium carnipullorum TaxID=1124835 RepID=A0A376DPN4_CHRCU|nr:hypothetical protein EG346_09915 [Chryseobacterium carnipullorum]AZA63407.1 hypothetical protein EG345_00815 [Chryseobacterium carnipullorum]STC92441.1 Uncharacterised protein [Chryseobacterium carnipullorum]
MKNIFREPAEPFTFFSYSDFLILIIINLILYLLLKKQLLKLTRINKIMIGIFFLIIVPLLSTQIELYNVHYKFEIVDSFNLLYVIFKFPFWWLIGIINIYLIKIIVKKYI